MWGNSMREKRETPWQTPTLDGSADRSKKAKSRKVDNARGAGVDGRRSPVNGRTKPARKRWQRSRRGKEVDKGNAPQHTRAGPRPEMRVTGIVARTTSRIPTSGCRHMNPR